jgi:hypothetical protein
MSMLTDVRTKLLALPAEKKRANRVNSATHYRNLLRGHAARLSKAIAAQSLVPAVFNSADLGKSTEQSKKAAHTAARLHKNLAGDMDLITAEKISKAVTTLGTYAETAERAGLNEWQKCVKTVLGQYEQLVQALAEIDPALGVAPTRILNRLRDRLNRPPVDDTDALALRDDLTRLAESITNTGLAGAVGKFVIAALDNGADLRLIDQPEVRAFLDKDDRWKLFSIHFRAMVRRNS